MVTCKYCYNDFKTKSSLNYHVRTAKYCLKKRKVSFNTLSLYKCEICEKEFVLKDSFNKHSFMCQNNPGIIKLKERLTLMEDRLNNAKHELDLKDEMIKQQDKQIKDLQDKLENVAIVSASRPTTNNTQINNYIQKLEVITDQHLLDQAQHLTIEHIKKGPAGYAEYAMAHPFKERLICVDYARRKVKFKESDGTLINDPEMNRLASKFFQSIKDRNTELIQEYGAMLSKDFAENVDKLGELADFKVGVTRGAAGEKTEFSHEVIKNVCSQSVV